MIFSHSIKLDTSKKCRDYLHYFFCTGTTVFVLFLILLQACGSKSTSPNPSSNTKPVPVDQSSQTGPGVAPGTAEVLQPPSTSSPGGSAAKRYNFRLSHCQTGEHNFDKQVDPKDQLLKYCQTLIDDGANNHCAAEIRFKTFHEECQEVKDQFSDRSIRLDQDHQSIIVIVKTVINNFSAIEFENTIAPLLWVEKAQQKLTETKWRPFKIKTLNAQNLTKTDSANDATDIPFEDSPEFIQMQSILEATKDCGLNFLGLSCYGQEWSPHSNRSGTIQINSHIRSYFHIIDYPNSEQMFLWEFPVQIPTEQILPGTVRLFLVRPGVNLSALSAPKLQSGDYLELAEFSTTPISNQVLFDLVTKARNVRQLVNLSHLLLSSEKLTQLAKKDLDAFIYSQLKKQDKLLEEETNASHLSDYLELMSSTSHNQDDFRKDLVALSKSTTNQQLILEASLYLINYAPTDKILSKKVSLALTSDDPQSILRTIKTINTQPLYQVSLLDQKRLIRLLTHDQKTVRDAAYELILSRDLDPSVEPLLATQISRNSLVDEIRLKFFMVLGKLSTSSSKTLRLQSLMRFSSQLPLEQYHELLGILVETGLGDEQVEAIGRLFSHPNNALRFEAANLLLQLKTPLSKGELIRQLPNDHYEIRAFIEGHLENTEISDELIPLLMERSNSGYNDVTQSIIRILNKMGSNASKFSLIELMSIFDDSLRREVLYFVDSTMFAAVHTEKLGKQLYNRFNDSRASALEALGRMYAVEATHVLAANMIMPDSALRSKLLAILRGRPIDYDTVSLLQKALEGPYVDAMLTAIAMLGEANTVSSMFTLSYAICSPILEVRNAVFQELYSHATMNSLTYQLVSGSSECGFVSVRQNVIDYISVMPDREANLSYIYMIVDETDPDLFKQLWNNIASRKVFDNASSALRLGLFNSDNSDLQMFFIKLFDRMITPSSNKDPDKRSVEVDIYTQGDLIEIILAHENPDVVMFAKELLSNVHLKYDMNTVDMLVYALSDGSPAEKQLGLDYLLNMKDTTVLLAINKGAIADLLYIKNVIVTRLKDESDPDFKAKLEDALSQITAAINKIDKTLPDPPAPHGGGPGGPH